MSNPIVVQVNILHPYDEYFCKSDDEVTELECCDAFDYVCNYLSNFSNEEIKDETDLSRDDYEDELLSDMPMIAEFHQLAFKDALQEWAKLNGTEVEKMVRGYVDCGFGCFQMVHGFGYDWMSDDVYGGSADGDARKNFDAWAEEELGVRFIFE